MKHTHWLWLAAALLLLASCEHKELCFHHPHTVRVRVAFDWRDAPQADPDGMCVYFYPEEGGEGRRFDFSNTTGGEVELGVGRYRVVCYNNDTEIVEFSATGDFAAHGVFTREGNVLEPIYGNGANYAPRAARRRRRGRAGGVPRHDVGLHRHGGGSDRGRRELRLRHGPGRGQPRGERGAGHNALAPRAGVHLHLRGAPRQQPQAHGADVREEIVL